MPNLREKLDNLYCGLCSLAVFRNLLDDSVISALANLMREQAEDNHFSIDSYSGFVSELYRHSANLSTYILDAVLNDDNFYIVRKGAGFTESEPEIENAVYNELGILQEISCLSPDDLQCGYYRNITLPRWRNSEIDFVPEYRKHVEDIGKYGYGKYRKNIMFNLKNGRTFPVSSPDRQKLSELFGYERERNAVINNTLALINGKKAQNVLLYGDAGTGKSSTVKAVVNEFADRGLRLVEITKEQLRDIPALIDELSKNPLKFIIFIDDLSFTAGEDCFGALKAVLEGSVSSRSDNTVIYATSKRRHLITASFSDRDGDDDHRNDTMQEMLSLSARFGLRVNFSRPDKKNYTAIAVELAKANNINLTDDEIILKAEQFAISSGNGRSPRTARQFINQLIMEM